MHYPFRDYLLDFAARGKINGSQFSRLIIDLIQKYPAGQEFSQFLTIGNHDTERVFTVCGEEDARVRLVFLLQFAYPGAPVIYYGDEIGMPGGRDPDNRRAFPWSEEKWIPGLRSYVKDLIRIRLSSRALRRGQLVPVRSNDPEICAFGRSAPGEQILTVVNATREERVFSITVPPGSLADSEWHDC